MRRVESNRRFRLAQLRSELKPFKLHFFPRLRSTNDHAALLRKRGKLFAPAIVLTSRQIAGRGRGTNTWWSAEGSLTVTFVFPVEEHLAPHQVPLLAGLAVRDAAAEMVESAAGDSVALKWPNDVVHHGKKLAGLLCERVMKADLVGVGLNVNNDPRHAPAGLRERIVSLSKIAGRSIDMNDALIRVARHLHRALSRRGERLFTESLQRYDRFHVLEGRTIRVIEAGSPKAIRGRCLGLDQQGRLLLRVGNKTLPIIAGQVQML
jgi:BirA family biotin operon repressor/biotin-[acetyl-CoA-carboxylase] ligase